MNYTNFFHLNAFGIIDLIDLNKTQFQITKKYNLTDRLGFRHLILFSPHCSKNS